MALSKFRREARIQSLLNAGDMIENVHQGGLTHEDMEMTVEEFQIFCDENMRTAKILYKMAMKLMEKNDET